MPAARVEAVTQRRSISVGVAARASRATTRPSSSTRWVDSGRKSSSKELEKATGDDDSSHKGDSSSSKELESAVAGEE
jgi:hypothetical protein